MGDQGPEGNGIPLPAPMLTGKPSLSDPNRYNDSLYLFVQYRGDIDRIEADEIPPPEYCEQLRVALQKKLPGVDPELLDRAIPLVAAFDTAMVFAMSFGIAQF